MEVTKEQFLEWKQNPVTKAVFEIVSSRIVDAKDILSIHAGIDVRDDSVLVGMIKAFNEVLDVSWDE